jgi:hypothetical protein
MGKHYKVWYESEDKVRSGVWTIFADNEQEAVQETEEWLNRANYAGHELMPVKATRVELEQRQYPRPTKAAMERAKAHKRMAHALLKLANSGADCSTQGRVIQDEATRQYHMVQTYLHRYGPNAGEL